MNLIMMYINLRRKFHLHSCSVTLLIVTECVQLPQFFLNRIDMSREESDVSIIFKVKYGVEFKYYLFGELRGCTLHQ